MFSILFDIYQYGEAGRQIRSFLWDEFADWYIEISKYQLYGDDAGRERQKHNRFSCSRSRYLFAITCIHICHSQLRKFGVTLPVEGEALIIAEMGATANEQYISEED